ncbi:MAG: DUF2232 domain-containing protein [Gaiellales bacterium]|nr:MAG: DUF2232 domain-containing protein [Gaiellales bacterium]
MGGFPKKAVIDGGKAVTLCAALGLMIGAVSEQVVPVEAVNFALLLLPFVPIPVALLTARHGFMAGALAGIAIGSLCTTWVVLTGSSVGLLVFLFAAVAGVFAGAGFSAGVGIYRMLAMLMAMYIGIGLAWFGAHTLTVEAGPIAVLQEFAAAFARQTSGFFQSLGMAEGSSDEVLSRISESTLYSMPALLVVIAGLMSIVTVAFSRLLFRVVKQPFPRDIVFSELRLHFGYVYLFIASLALILASYALDGAAGAWTEEAGGNLMFVSTVLFFIQGLAIAAWFLRRRKASGAVRTVTYICLGILELTFTLVSFVGIFDVFMDFRKRLSGGSGQAGINDQK